MLDSYSITFILICGLFADVVLPRLAESNTRLHYWNNMNVSKANVVCVFMKKSILTYDFYKMPFMKILIERFLLCSV